MKISKVRIKNYRRFVDTTINFEKSNFAVLAGANNSGKTSLIQLFCKVFNNRGDINEKDLSIEKQRRFVELIYKDLGEEELDKKEFSDRLLSKVKELFMKDFSVTMRFTVSYEDESIGLFSNYLMDLDELKREFYFVYKLGNSFSKFEEEYKVYESKLYELFKARSSILTSLGNFKGDENDKLKLEEEKNYNSFNFSKQIFELYGMSLEDKYFYTDSRFNNLNKMEFKDFSKLFNFDYITADRELDDEKNSKKKITNSVIDSSNPLKDNSTWKKEFDELYVLVKRNIDEKGIEKKIKDKTFEAFKLIKDNIDLVGETQIDSIEALMNFEEKNLLELIKDSLTINYVYEKENHKIYLDESTQGLGFSNLIYISLQLMKYKSEIKDNTVNFFVIEEPEAHMHIQMQKVLLDYLNDLFNDNKKIQGLVSTHSNEIVKYANLDSLKVIRPIDYFQNKIADLSEFISENHADKIFYETFFKLNFSNMIFCDKAIIYEGDTERMYIESLISSTGSFDKLSRKYISYCQCGGAYAHKYKKLIEFLEIYACIFTDLDYSKETMEIKGLLEDESTNQTINNSLKELKNEPIKINDIYHWQNDNKHVVNNIGIFTQKETDGYARTLEEAMLFKYINIKKENFDDKGVIPDDFTVFTRLPLSFWKKFKEKSELKIVIPNINREKKALCDEKEKKIKDLKDTEVDKKNDIEKEYQKRVDELKKNKDTMVTRSIREIVTAMSKSKSDFMYSIIIKNIQEEMIPEYIKEGLLWLEKICIS